jgi:hypothetical protein
MGFFTKTVRTTTTRKVKAQQSKSMGSFGGKGKLVTGGGVVRGEPKQKRNTR